MAKQPYTVEQIDAIMERTSAALVDLHGKVERVARLAEVWLETGRFSPVYMMFAEDLIAVLNAQEPPNTGVL